MLNEQELKVGSKGQIVLPPEAMKKLKLQQGDKVLFRLEGDRVIVTKVVENNTDSSDKGQKSAATSE